MPQVGLVESYETPLGFYRFACEFRDWAERSHKETTDRYSPVPYYLYCRSIELALKAYLLAHGLSKREIASHSLLPLLAQARSLGLNSLINIEPTWETELARADDQYTKKDFEYFTVRFDVTHKPPLVTLRQLARALIGPIRQVCLDAAGKPPSEHVANENASFERKRRARKGATP